MRLALLKEKSLRDNERERDVEERPKFKKEGRNQKGRKRKGKFLRDRRENSSSFQSPETVCSVSVEVLDSEEFYASASVLFSLSVCSLFKLSFFFSS
jgi:hypothetical protein